MDLFIKIAQFIASISLLVIIHELGHFIFAKIFKTRVEKFYLFFNPWFSIFKFKKGETEYGIGWLPLGGYVKIAGMIDESMDKEQLKQPPQPYEFRSKPAYQRFLIITGGVLFNLIAGILIYSMILFHSGEHYLLNENVKDGIWCVDSLMYEIGLKNGDKIISINNKEIEKFNDILPEMFFAKNIVILRDKDTINLQVSEETIAKLIGSRKFLLIYPRVPFIIGNIPDTSPNKNSGLQPLDQIIAIEGINIKYLDEFKTIADTLKNRKVSLKILRNKKDTIDLIATIDKNGRIGVIPAIPSNTDELEKLGIYKFNKKEYNLLSSIPAGIKLTINNLKFYIKQFGLIFNFKTKAYKEVGGFISIGKLFPSTWDWKNFWSITALLSIVLAFMNILPIPALDGGHMMFILFEMITGKKPGEKFLEHAQIVGMIILFALLIFANANDIIKLFFK